MSIAILQLEGLGARIYGAEGPFGAAGQMPLPSFKFGQVVAGDAEAEFVYLNYVATASVTLRQGDWVIWDNTYQAILSGGAAMTSGMNPFGASCGTIYLGGRTADPAAYPNPGNQWSQTLTAGSYGIWVQRCGTSLMNVATINAQTKLMNTTTVAGQMNQPSAALAASMGVTGAWTAPLTGTFNATTVTGSAILTAVTYVLTAARGIVVGARVTGTGIPAGSYITSVDGSTVTINQAASASGTIVVTQTWNTAEVTTTNLSAVLTNVTSIVGLYPNMTITGTGIPASTTILSIGGIPGAYTITLSAACTATANLIVVTGTVYYEGFLRWPYISVQN
jgi:hypothetical protein